MRGHFKILFHEDGDPIDYRCIKRFIAAFPKHYHETVREIIEKSEKLDEEAFRVNVATLMPSFKMTRRGAFRGVRINERGCVSDPNNVISLCWKHVGKELQDLKEHIKEKASCKRSRVIIDVSSESRDSVIEKTSELFEELRTLTVKSGRVGRVAASKVLFSALPEVALPVDNLEWEHVFCTEKYREILSMMVNEIIEWERAVQNHPLETLEPHKMTLPAIYNILAMSVRPLVKANW